MITPASIMREYFKTGKTVGKHCKGFYLTQFADEYKGYFTQGGIPDGFGKHRDPAYDRPTQ